MATRAGETTLDDEARLFARHLVRRAPDAALVARYGAACARLFPGVPDARDLALLAFVRAHPWSLGPLDAVLALLRPQSLLRARLLVMAAILETTPAHAADFLPRPVGMGRLAWRLPVLGLVAIAQVLVGAAVYPIARGRA
jgi:hypothetical protein